MLPPGNHRHAGYERREIVAIYGTTIKELIHEEFGEALVAFDGPILVYSAYEKSRLKQLADEFPDLSAALNALIARLVDLLPIVRGAIYFLEFRFSNSIKSVVHGRPVSYNRSRERETLGGSRPPHACGKWAGASSSRRTPAGRPRGPKKVATHSHSQAERLRLPLPL
jgi:hypothetical protein